VRKQMAEQGFAAVQGLCDRAAGCAGLLDGEYGGDAIKIVNGVPLGLEVWGTGIMELI
jgi:hypothetical protein